MTRRCLLSHYSTAAANHSTLMGFVLKQRQSCVAPKCTQKLMHHEAQVCFVYLGFQTSSRNTTLDRKAPL